MNLSAILAMAIGLFFVYLLLSAITSYITEAVSTIFRLRAKNLADAVQKLLEPSTLYLNGEKRIEALRAAVEEEGANPATGSLDAPPERIRKLNGSFLKAFYEHPIILSLSKPNHHPSYISPQDFSITLLDLLMDSRQNRSLTAEQYLGELKHNVSCLNEDLRRTLMPLIEYAEMTETNPDRRIAQVRQNIDQWYSTTIERASGWYKNRVQRIGLLIGFMIAAALNADTIQIVQNLWQNTDMRQGMAEAAEQNVPPGPLSAEGAIQEFSKVNFPLGWYPLKDEKGQPNTQYANLSSPIGAFSKLMGLMITALAISVGSSIWFDILNRVINLRSTGTRPAQ